MIIRAIVADGVICQVLSKALHRSEGSGNHHPRCSATFPSCMSTKDGGEFEKQAQQSFRQARKSQQSGRSRDANLASSMRCSWSSPHSCQVALGRLTVLGRLAATDDNVILRPVDLGEAPRRVREHGLFIAVSPPISMGTFGICFPSKVKSGKRKKKKCWLGRG